MVRRTMSRAEIRFKLVVADLVRQGKHPVPTNINQALKAAGAKHRWRKLNTLNGRELIWLRADLGVSPIRGGWRKRAMGPCQLRCCKPDGAVLHGFLMPPELEAAS